MPKVSVITPTVRLDGLKVVEDALNKQTFRDFEWLICSKDPYDVQSVMNSSWILDDYEGGFWTLNRAYNKLFRHAEGEIIVSLQDWIWIPPDGLQKFVDAIETLGDTVIISGVGDQYEQIGRFGKPEVKIWSDPRKNDQYGSFYEVYANDAEWNWCAFPKVLIEEIGGMDEELDFLGYGGDQFQVGERWDFMGNKFFLDQTNESFTVRHDRSKHGGQENWDKNHVLFNGKYQERKKELISEGKWPKLDYLKPSP